MIAHFQQISDIRHPRSAGETWEKTVKTTFLRAIVAGASLYAMPALAQDSDTLAVQSQVAPFCSELSISSAPMDLGSLTGATGQIVNDFSGAIENERELATSFYCNAPAQVTITAEPLLHDTVSVVGDSASFTNRVDYTATLEWDDVQGTTDSTVADGDQIDAPEANIGPMTLTLSNPTVDNNRRPVAGGYSGQVRLTVALTQ